MADVTSGKLNQCDSDQTCARASEMISSVLISPELVAEAEGFRVDGEHAIPAAGHREG